MVAHVLKHLDVFKHWLRDRIREFYGTGDGNLGPFSVKSYLQWMLEDKVWGGYDLLLFIGFYVGM